jgi:hypothetical protein
MPLEFFAHAVSSVVCFFTWLAHEKGISQFQYWPSNGMSSQDEAHLGTI